MIGQYKNLKLKTVIQIPNSCDLIDGTRAEIIVGDRLTVEQLMYAMMLPSGNDAAHALALFCGCILLNWDPN
jgi:D-alanyl-D-alanine carboxypeptidase (penicillin-binding protein 5/6)